ASGSGLPSGKFPMRKCGLGPGGRVMRRLAICWSHHRRWHAASHRKPLCASASSVVIGSPLFYKLLLPLKFVRGALLYNERNSSRSNFQLAGRKMIHPDYREFSRLARQSTLVPIVKSITADLLTPVSAFLAIAAREPNAFLLESVERGEQIGRYTFLGAQPYMRLEAHGNEIVLHHGKRKEQRQGSALQTAKELLRQHRPAAVPGLPPFTAGAVGYCSYDIVRQLENIGDNTKDDLHVPDCVLMFFDRLLAFDHLRHQIHIIAVADVSTESPRRAYDRAVRDIGVLEKKLASGLRPGEWQKTSGKRRGRLRVRPRTARKEFEQSVQNAKEYAEHVMLVDLERNDLGRVSEYGSVKVKDLMYVERYSHVMHIVSALEGKLRPELHALDAFAACFPAGSLSGAPKVRAMQVIEELEPTRRGVYGGSVLYADFAGNLDSCIAIRTMLMKGKKAYLQAGAGIVADSDPEREYEECMNKAKAVLRAVEAARGTD